MKSALIPLSKIVVDETIQVRVNLNNDVVADYAEAMARGDKFPHLVVFGTEESAILSDGRHRFEAAKSLGVEDVWCEIHAGGREDALRYALSANAPHGLQRTNEDKRKSVQLALLQWPNLSNVEIARICWVTDKTVASLRGKMESTSEIPRLETRTGADGKTRKLPAKQSGPEEKGLHAPTVKGGQQVAAYSGSEHHPAPSAESTLSAQAPALVEKLKAQEEKPAVKLTATELVLTDELNVAKANIEYLLDCVSGHSCNVDACGEAAVHFRHLASLVMKYQKELVK